MSRYICFYCNSTYVDHSNLVKHQNGYAENRVKPCTGFTKGELMPLVQQMLDEKGKNLEEEGFAIKKRCLEEYKAVRLEMINFLALE